LGIWLFEVFALGFFVNKNKGRRPQITKSPINQKINFQSTSAFFLPLPL